MDNRPSPFVEEAFVAISWIFRRANKIFQVSCKAGGRCHRCQSTSGYGRSWKESPKVDVC